jgi:preprotein translocase subunit SecE
VGTFFQELLNTGIYKRNQGRITRQVTFASLTIVLVLGCYRLHVYMKMSDWVHNLPLGSLELWLPGLLPGLLVLASGWLSYRIVNIPGVADFLIAVEAEMNKVSWPTRMELFRASVVVLFCIITMAAILYGYDIVWQFIFKRIGVLG